MSGPGSEATHADQAAIRRGGTNSSATPTVKPQLGDARLRKACREARDSLTEKVHNFKES